VAVIGPTDPNDSTPHQAYVVNSGDFTVSVIDTDPSSATYNHVITTIPVGYYPTVVTASPEGDRVYVGNYDTVSVIDTTTNAVTATIPVPSDGCGQGCYNGVWDVAVSPDGSRLYAADGVSDTVVVYDTATMQRVASVDVGPNQQDYARNVAISPDGTRAYAVVLNGFVGDITAPSMVSVIDTDPTSDTYNTTIARISVPDGAQDVAVSTDGSRAYVTHSDGKTITVIDTNTVIGTFTTDQNPTAGSQYITVDPDDTLYITDPADGTTYAVTVGDATAL
jgi:YVTN family beta-propeller protein